MIRLVADGSYVEAFSVLSSITERRFLTPFVLASLALLAAGSDAAEDASATSADPLNVVFIFTDDIGFGDIACHRDDTFATADDQPNGRSRRSDEWRGEVRTPNLDRIAREGADFHQFMVASPVCAPSRVAVMTGQFPSRNRIHHIFTNPHDNRARGIPNWLPLDAPFLPRVLHASGYTTGHFGKWHLGHHEDEPSPQRRGFDRAVRYGDYAPHVFDKPAYQRFEAGGGAMKQDASSWLSVAATDHCLDFIRESATKPFYVNLWLHETHHVVSARPQDRVGYEDVPEPYQTYYAAVTRMDRQVGRVLDLLDELKLAESTLVIFSSDNGPENHTPRLDDSVGSPAGMRGRKRSLMMGGVTVPFLCRLPGVIPAGHVDRTSSLSAVDLFPTILSMTGVAPENKVDFDGIDISDALKGDPIRRERPLFWFWLGNHGGDNWPVFGVRRDQYIMLVDPAAERTELYDVLRDRFQTNDLSEKRADVVAELNQALQSWQQSLPPLPPANVSEQIASRRNQGNPADVTAPSDPKRASTMPRSPARSKADSPDREAVFSHRDGNGDGFLDPAEYGRDLPNPASLQRRFRHFDTNADGKISLEEFTQP